MRDASLRKSTLRKATLTVLLLFGTALLSGHAFAQQTGEPEGPPPPQRAAPPKAVMPDADKIVLLIRSTLLTLNDALQTGNFTVLRDVGAPGFRAANSAAKLSQAFANLAQRGIDLSAVAVIAPKLAEAPVIDAKTNMLRIKGTFPGNPLGIEFELLFQPVAGRWRLFGLSVQPTSPAAAVPPAEPSASTPKAQEPEKKTAPDSKK